jgi:outer membrane protein OmpA-like peptidoglycan-associated protein
MSFFLRALSAAALLAALLSAALAVTASAADRQGEIRLAQGNPPGAKGAQAGDPDEEPGAKKKKKKGKQGPPEGSEGQGGGGPPPGAPPGAKKEFQKGPPSQGFTPGTPPGGQQGQKKIAPTKKDAGKGYIGPKPAGQQTETQKSLTKKKTTPGTPQGGTAGAPPGGQAPAVTTSPKTIKPTGPGGQPVNGTLKAQGTPKKPGIGPLAPVKGVPPKKIEKPEERVERSKKEFDAFKKRRRETVEKGGKRIVIEEPGKRKIIKEGGKIIIRHDENERFRRIYRNARVHRRVDGSQLTIILRPGGTEVFTEVDMYGRPLRRWRRYPDGTVVVLFDNRSYYRRFGYRRPDVFNVYINLGPPVIRIPRERYIVAFEDSPDDIVYETLIAPPVDPLDRTYSLEEIRYNRYLRERMRRLDLNTISFDFGSWEVDPDQYPKLERLARIINRILEENPDEMLMIEGYTDAVGSEEDNLSLSDRRAEEVAVVLTETYGVPPENLTTQGYGEQFLRVETDGPSVANRYVAVRRITPLLAR